MNEHEEEDLGSQPDAPGIWSYEGDKHRRHDVSICIGGFDDGAAPHSCFATAHGKTAQEAHDRAEQIVRALRLAAKEGREP